MSENEYNLSVYITNLLVETLPHKQKSLDRIEGLGLQRDKLFFVLQILLTRSIRQQIGSLKESEMAAWKAKFMQNIKRSLQSESFEAICVLNLQPMMRTVIIQAKYLPDMTRMCEAFEHRLDALNKTLEESYNSKVISCWGPVVEDLFELSSAYKRTRQLQNYHLTIGVGNHAYFDTFQIDDDYSLFEYKYIHLFKRLMDEKDWVALYELLNNIKIGLIDRHTNDSKTSYIYKEIFAATIRYLFEMPELHQEEIKALNEGIIMFDEMFDDVEEIHHYFMSVFHNLTSQFIDSKMHPSIRKTLTIIHSRYNQPLTLEEIAGQLGISSAYLSRLFKGEMKVNFKKYLTIYRIRQAKQLLISTSKKIQTIGYEVGYRSETQFVRAFKSLEGMPPSKFRLTINYSNL